MKTARSTDLLLSSFTLSSFCIVDGIVRIQLLPWLFQNFREISLPIKIFQPGSISSLHFHRIEHLIRLQPVGLSFLNCARSYLPRAASFQMAQMDRISRIQLVFRRSYHAMTYRNLSFGRNMRRTTKRKLILTGIIRVNTR